MNWTLCRFICINYKKESLWIWFFHVFVFQVPPNLDCFPEGREGHWACSRPSSDVVMTLNVLDIHHCETVVQTPLRYLRATETVFYSSSDGDQTLCKSDCRLSSIRVFCWMITILCHFMKIFALLSLDRCYCCLSMLIMEKLIAIFDNIIFRLWYHRTSLLLSGSKYHYAVLDLSQTLFIS